MIHPRTEVATGMVKTGQPLERSITVSAKQEEKMKINEGATNSIREETRTVHDDRKSHK